MYLKYTKDDHGSEYLQKIFKESKSEIFNSVGSLYIKKYISVSWFLEYAKTQFGLNLAEMMQ